MPTIKFSISKKKQLPQGSELLLRLSISRRLVFRAKTGFFIKPEQWNASTEKVIIPRMHTIDRTNLIILQGEIDSFKNYILQKCSETPIEIISKDWLENTICSFHNGTQIDENEDFETTFHYYISTQVSTLQGKKLFKCLLNTLKRFELYYGKGFRLNLNDFTDKHLMQFEEFLKIEHTFFDKNKKCIRFANIYKAFPNSRIPQQRGGNSIFTILKRFRTFFNWAVKTNRTENNPFKKYKLHECVYGSPFYMTVEERNTLADFDFSNRPQLAIQRDIFIFQSLVGMRIGDLYALTQNNIVNSAVEYIPHKTINSHGGTVRVPLCSKALEILEKYNDNNRIELLPFISEQKYNQAIKTMLKLAGITRVVTIINPKTRQEEQHPIYEVASSHMARRNFIGNIYKKTQDPNAIASMTGHVEGSRAFARYRTIDDELKRNLIATLE